jgi:hypothetical protein
MLARRSLAFSSKFSGSETGAEGGGIVGAAARRRNVKSICIPDLGWADPVELRVKMQPQLVD